MGVLFSFLSLAGAGASQTQQERESADRLPTAQQDGYRIGPGDKLDIQVVGLPDMSRDALTVDSRGLVRMPLLKLPIGAACSTADELAGALEKQYARYLREPQVTVSVREYSSQPIEVVGSVFKPGLFQLQREVRLRELMSIAGGIKPDASPLAQLIHDESYSACEAGAADAVPTFRHETIVKTVDLTGLMHGQGENPVVRPGDLINVPQADQIFVVGQVVKPTALSLTTRLTVSRAVAMAGGRSRDARSQARISRVNRDGLANTSLVVDLKAIEQNGAPDVELQAGDVVEVPTAQGRQALKVVLTSLLSAGLYYPLLIIR